MNNDEEKKELKFNKKDPNFIVMIICCVLVLVLNLILIIRAATIGGVTVNNYILSCISTMCWAISAMVLAIFSRG